MSFEISFEPKSRAVSLNSPSLLNQQRWSLVEQAVDLRRLWTILSHRLKPLYGYATSNVTFDTALADPEISNLWSKFETKVVYHSLPPVLFWANYFDWSYYENIDKTVFNDIHHRKFVMPEDYVCIYLAEFPWDDPQLAILKNWKYQLAISE